MRVGVYSDLVYRRDADGLSNNQAFIRFITSLPPRVDEVVLFGRFDPLPGRSAYAVPSDGVRLVALPYYRRATDLRAVLRSVRRSCAVFTSQLSGLDVVLVFGPQPLALAFGAIASRQRVPLVLGVRHDYPRYIRSRLPNRWWLWAVPIARTLEAGFLRLARRAPTIALGEELARRYRGGAAVISMGFSLVPRAELRAIDEALGTNWDDDRVILTVGRLAAEKNPFLLLDIIRELRARDRRWRLLVVGDGPLRAEMQRRIDASGLTDAVQLAGEVPNGPQLWELYRTSHLFLHVSFTEGLPQVLFEAQAAGIPIVATAVGGVADALGDGTGGLLIPPSDAPAAVAAVIAVAGDEALRRRLIAAGLANAERHSLEAQLDQLAAFLRDARDPAARS
jgi:glycosyltransferase involved in cell wall biosynthesis